MKYPEEFVRRMSDYGFEDVVSALDNEPTISIRLNPKKVKPYIAVGERVGWCEEGYYLDERPRFTLDPALHQGRYYVQDASSMFVNHVVKSLIDSDEPLLVADLCAAPGGKTLAIADALPAESMIVVNDYDSRRSQVLSENIAKWGIKNVIVTSGNGEDVAKALKHSVDIVISDVPCSGEGMMRKDEEAVRQWSPQLIDSCVVRQRKIARRAWESIRPGGVWIYSTCTFNRLENEGIIEEILKEGNVAEIDVPIDPDWGISEGLSCGFPCYRFLPGRTRGEGLFMCVLKKEGDSRQKLMKPGKSSETILTEGDTESVYPTLWLPVLKRLEGQKDIKILRAGVPIHTLKGKSKVPTQELALLTDSRFKDGYPRYEVDRETALKYLSHESLTLPAEVEQGFVLLEYQGVGLGFVKNLGKRANNLYPINWRIRHGS